MAMHPPSFVDVGKDARITMNLLKRDMTSNVARKIRHLKACANDRYLAQLLGWHGE